MHMSRMTIALGLATLVACARAGTVARTGTTSPDIAEADLRHRLFLISDESAYMSGVCLPATDGGNLARTSIIFPGDLGGEAGVLPESLRY